MQKLNEVQIALLAQCAAAGEIARVFAIALVMCDFETVLHIAQHYKQQLPANMQAALHGENALQELEAEMERIEHMRDVQVATQERATATLQ